MVSLTFFTITIAFNHASAFSPSEEIDYSMPFEFESYSDLPVDYSDGEKFTNFTEELNNLDLSENKLSHIRDKTQPSSIQDNDHLAQNTNEKFGISSPLINSTRSIQSEKTEDYSSGPQTKIDGTKSELKEFSLYPKMNDDKIAIINFDDNWRSQYQYAKPILDKFQFKATFYVVCDYIDNKNRISWDELKNLYSEGHEIGSHTMSHANLDNIMMDGTAHNEIIESKKCIEDRGIKVNSFSYPFNSGDDNLEILDLVSNNYEFARTAGGDPNDDIGSERESLKRYTIVGWSHDAERKKHFYSDSEMLQKFEEYVNEYSKEDEITNHIPIIIYHKIGDTEDAYSTSIDLFESEMSYLYENGFKVITMDKVFGKN